MDDQNTKIDDIDSKGHVDYYSPETPHSGLPSGEMLIRESPSGVTSQKPEDSIEEKGESTAKDSLNLDKVRKDIQTVGKKTESIVRKAADVAKQAPQVTGDALEWSRDSRLATEQKNKKVGAFQKFFKTGVTGWIARSIAQAIPSPVGYGPGDAITGASALLGKDVLSGDHLDLVDRGLYAIATVIPGVPATILVTPARLLRRAIEDAFHTHRTGQKHETVQNTKAAIEAGRQIKDVIHQHRQK